MTEPIKLPPEFRSGNSIPVERATITRERMIEILAAAIEADRQQREQEYPHEQMDAIGATRFKVVPCPENVGLIFSTHAVKAGDGEQILWHGSKSSCEHVASRLTGAFFDGGWMLFGLLGFAGQKQRGEPVAYCDACQKVGMRNCSDFVNCGNARCVMCKRLFSAPQPTESEQPCFCDRMYPDSNPDASCGDCPTRDYKQPAAPTVKQSLTVEPERIQFPAHLRKMWSGSEVQAWLDERFGTEPENITAKGSLERYRKWQETQAKQSEITDKNHSVESGVDPVRVPSDTQILGEWAFTKNTGDMRIDLVAFARTLLAKYGQQQNQQQNIHEIIPDGYKLVPIEPTDDMLNAARDWSDKKYGKPIGNDAAVGCFQAMLEAAPEPEEPA